MDPDPGTCRPWYALLNPVRALKPNTAPLPEGAAARGNRLCRQ